MDFLVLMEDQEEEVYLDPWDHPELQEQTAKEEALDHRDPKVVHAVYLSL